jgi:hypothetical protein
MQTNMVFLGGVGAGAGLMLLLDPAQGRRRRALMRDKLGRAARGTSSAVGTTGRDLGHRLAGAAARLRRVTGTAPGAAGAVSDAVLCDRVRARLGHVVSHPRAIDVFAQDGRVVLTGAIPGAERHAAISAIARVPGVQIVDDCLDEAADLDTVAAISQAFDGQVVGWPARWSPTTRLLIGVVVGSVAAYGAARAVRTRAAGSAELA